MIELFVVGISLIGFSSFAFAITYAATDYITGTAPKWVDYLAYLVRPTLITGLISLATSVIFI